MSQEHNIEFICVLAPFTVSDPDDDVNLSELELGEEETSQGYFRSAALIECSCGEEFTGYETAQRDYQEHIDETE